MLWADGWSRVPRPSCPPFPGGEDGESIFLHPHLVLWASLSGGPVTLFVYLKWPGPVDGVRNILSRTLKFQTPRRKRFLALITSKLCDLFG